MPAYTSPSDDANYVTTTIHLHPTTGFTIGTAQFPAIPASGTPLDAADTKVFSQHQTNFIVGRLGNFTGSLGIAIYKRTTPELTLTQKAVQKILIVVIFFDRNLSSKN